MSESGEGKKHEARLINLADRRKLERERKAHSLPHFEQIFREQRLDAATKGRIQKLHKDIELEYGIRNLWYSEERANKQPDVVLNWFIGLETELNQIAPEHRSIFKDRATLGPIYKNGFTQIEDDMIVELIFYPGLIKGKKVLTASLKKHGALSSVIKRYFEED